MGDLASKGEPQRCRNLSILRVNCKNHHLKEVSGKITDRAVLTERDVKLQDVITRHEPVMNVLRS